LEVAGLVGSQDWLRERAGLTAAALVRLADEAASGSRELAPPRAGAP
jgi:hypothetical protein